MSELKIQNCDENLSEELLSEDSTPWKVKIMNKLTSNMERSSFKTCTELNMKRVEVCRPRTLKISSFSPYYKRKTTVGPKDWSKLSCSPVQPGFAPLSDENSKSPWSLKKEQVSMKDDITELLKISAQIRQKRTTSQYVKRKKRILSDSETPDKKRKYTNCDKLGDDWYFTFGA